MYLASSIEQAGHEAEIVDLAGGVDWRKIVSGLEADLFGVTCVTPNFNTVKEICRLLPPKPIIVGGVHPTFLPIDTLKNIRCNAIVRGEGEVIIKKVLYDLSRGGFPTKIYWGGIVPVKDIPKPARYLVDLHRYSPGGEGATPIYTSRGCPYNCNFCSKVTGQRYRALPIPRVLEEVEDCISLGFKNIVFGDDNIIVQPDRVRRLLKALKPFNVEFRLNQDARAVEEDLVELAAEAGCTEISFGIESGSQAMLDAMNKRTTVEANMRALEVTKKHGVTAKAYFVVNFPGETEETVKETLRFAEQARPDKWLLSAFAPLPGCVVFANPEKYGVTWMSSRWEDYYLVGKDGDFKPCFTTEYLTVEKQIQLHDMMYSGLKEIIG